MHACRHVFTFFVSLLYVHSNTSPKRLSNVVSDGIITWSPIMVTCQTPRIPTKIGTWNFCSTFRIANCGSLQISWCCKVERVPGPSPHDASQSQSLIPESVIRYSKLMMSLECRLYQTMPTTPKVVWKKWHHHWGFGFQHVVGWGPSTFHDLMILKGRGPPLIIWGMFVRKPPLKPQNIHNHSHTFPVQTKRG